MPAAARHLLLALIAVLALVPPAAADYEAMEVLSGLSSPLYVAESPDGTGRLFIVEQSGRIKIYVNGGLLPDPFLNLASQVAFGGERGLLGLAFHPEFADNGHFYVNFTPLAAGCAQSNVCSIVARFTVSGGDPNEADLSSRFDLMEIVQPNSNHNGGHLVFGPDGYLYIGWGDGGSSGDPGNRAQDGQELLGKMLRIDVDGGAPYGIPGDNPFVGNGDFLDEIWAYGLRNPWRYSFDKLTGDLWIGDVGQWTYEEVDFQPASSSGGENYGWRLMEGEHCFNPPSNCNDGSLVLPVTEYSHGGGRCSVTGGYVYRGVTIPELHGLYLFGDYCSQDVWAYDPDTDIATPILTSQNLGNITSFGEDLSGEIYITASGKLWKLVGDPTDVPIPRDAGFLQLGPGYPNPFRTQTRLSLSLDEAESSLAVGIYSVDGRLIRHLHEGTAPAGTMRLEWDGRDDAGRHASAGVYFLRAESRRESEATRLILLR